MPEDPSQSEGSGRPRRIRSLMRHRDFRLFLCTRSFNMIASQMFVLVVGWQIYDITGDALSLGLIGICLFAPTLLLFPLSGLVADQIDRRFVLLATCGLEAAACAVLLWHSVAAEPEVWPIYLMVLLYSSSRTFFNPAVRALLPTIVPLALFPNAIASSSTVTKLSMLGGPVLGGVLLAAIGHWVYAVMILVYLAAGAAAIRMNAREAKAHRSPFSLSEVFSGLVYVRRKPILVGAMTLDFMAVVSGTILGLLPMFARDILNVGPEGLGILRAMPAVGAIAIAAVLAQGPPIRPAGLLMFLSLTIYGVTIFAFGLSTVFWLSLVLLVVYGAADMMSSMIRQTLVQMATPEHLRGRVGAIESLSANGSEGLGNFRAGITAAWLGPVVAVGLGGLAAIGIAWLWWGLFRDLRRVDRIDQQI